MNNRHSARRAIALLSTAILLACAASSRATTPVTIPLYDASGGSLPGISNGWLYGESPSGAGTQALTGGAAKLDTTANITGKAGYGTILPSGDLDPTVGYTLDFTVKIESENNGTDNDRSGFDVLMVSNDPTKSLELAFWTNKVFALEGGSPTPAFTQAEGTTTPFDATVYHNYQLSVLGSAYTLYDGTTPLFSGALRDYTGSSATFGPLLVYQTSRTLFFGDDTTSAEVVADIQKISLVTAPVPEPATLPLLALSALIPLRRRR